MNCGVNTGPPERITIEFEAAVAPSVREREWHPSQRLRDRRDGGVTMELNVYRDAALRSWILSFGPTVRVLAPASLVEEIVGALREAEANYQRLTLASPGGTAEAPVQRRLPFSADIRRVS